MWRKKKITKSEIRKFIIEKRKKLSKKEIYEKSSIVGEEFLKSEYYKNSRVIMSYVSIKNEVDTGYINGKILIDGKKLILPKTDMETNNIIPLEIKNINELIEGRYGILEPEDNEKNIIDLENIDIVIVPAVAFDKEGYRIGFGKGYYDRFLKEYEGIKIGIAYDFQIIDRVPIESHDMKVDFIITG